MGKDGCGGGYGGDDDGKEAMLSKLRSRVRSRDSKIENLKGTLRTLQQIVKANKTLTYDDFLITINEFDIKEDDL